MKDENLALKLLLVLFAIVLVWFIILSLFEKTIIYEKLNVIREEYGPVVPDICDFVIPIYVVTVYWATSSQCDEDPHILADGTVIDISRAGEYKYCALSREMLTRWGGPFSYGDKIYISNAGKFTGVWTVRDTMNKRWESRIDLLTDIGTGLHKFTNVTICKIQEDEWKFGDAYTTYCT